MSFTYVSSQQNGDSAGGTSADIQNVAYTAGRLYVAFTRWTHTATGVTVTAIDYPFGTPMYTVKTPQDRANGDGGFDGSCMGYIIAPATTTQSTWARFSTSVSNRWLHIWEYTVSATPSFDVESATGNGSSSAPASAAFTTTGTDELVVAGLSWHQGGTSPTFSSFLINGGAADHSLVDTPTDHRSASWDKVFAATFSSGTAACSSTQSRAWLVNALSFKIAAAAPPEETIVRTSICIPIRMGY